MLFFHNNNNNNNNNNNIIIIIIIIIINKTIGSVHFVVVDLELIVIAEE